MPSSALSQMSMRCASTRGLQAICGHYTLTLQQCWHGLLLLLHGCSCRHRALCQQHSCHFTAYPLHDTFDQLICNSGAVLQAGSNGAGEENRCSYVRLCNLQDL